MNWQKRVAYRSPMAPLQYTHDVHNKTKACVA
eukprot:SAG11_NODE_30275_length_302_cov_1.019704_1_plen_31_part_10